MSESVAITDPRVQELLAEASAWRLLGLLFERPRDGWREDVEALSRVVSDAGITTAADAAHKEATEGLHLAILGPGGPVSPREVSYRGMEDPGHIIADIRAFYDAFAFQPQTEEAPDHLSVETGFVGYLCVKEAYARTRGNVDEAEVAEKAAARFCEGHLSPLAWSVAERLQATSARYLSLAATALARRTGPCRDSETAAKAPLWSCDDCLECGEE